VLPQDATPAVAVAIQAVAAVPEAAPASHDDHDSSAGAADAAVAPQPDAASPVLSLVVPQALPPALITPPASAAPLAGGILPVAVPVASAAAGAVATVGSAIVGSASPAAVSSASVAPADEAPAQQPQAPVVQPTTLTPVAAPPISAPAPAASVPAASPVEVVPLATQLARPLLGLRSAGDGNHVMTINVTPDNLGPVVVRAHVSGDTVRIELVAPTDQAREAIKAIMPELRRDLFQAGGQTSLDLSSSGGRGGDGTFRDSDSAPRQPEQFRQPAGQGTTQRQRTTDSLLDVLA
jgi:flagellar hook-length control protein FliK